MKPLFAIDSAVYIFRSYFALEPRWHTADGRPTEAVYGFAAFLLRLLSNEHPDYVGAAFDESLETGFRHRLYPPYKANRGLPDENLAFQLGACRDVAAALGIPTFACAEYEADDYLATLAASAKAGQPVYVLSRDKDLAQLISDSVSLWDYGYGDPVGREAHVGKFGFEPALVPDFLALVGDSSDNIPGVPGVGAKTATAILRQLGAIEHWIDTPQLLAEVPVRGSVGLPARVAGHRQQILLARQLTGLRQVPHANASLSVLRWGGIDQAGAHALFARLGLAGLSRRLEQVASRQDRSN